mgnify:CR=1 FL=1
MTTMEELLQVNGRLTAVHVERWVARGLLRPSADARNSTSTARPWSSRRRTTTSFTSLAHTGYCSKSVAMAHT